MATYNQVYTYTITNGGGTVNLPCSDSTTTRYVFSGTATLAANWVIQPSGNATEGMEFDIRWQSLCTQGANTVTIFGRILSDDEALSDLTISCYYNGSSWDVDVTNNDLVIDTDSPVPFRGFKRTDPGDSSKTINGILYSTLWKVYMAYVNSTDTVVHGFFADSSTTQILNALDTSVGHNGNMTFTNFLDGLIGVFQTGRTTAGIKYGFSTHSDTTRASADFFEYDPSVDLDTKYIWIDNEAIKSKVMYNVVDHDNYEYNSIWFDDAEVTFGFGGTVVATVDTPPTNVVTMKLVDTTFNVIPSIPNYADAAAADADADLLSGALYTTTAGGRIVYRKP